MPHYFFARAYVFVLVLNYLGMGDLLSLYSTADCLLNSKALDC